MLIASGWFVGAVSRTMAAEAARICSVPTESAQGPEAIVFYLSKSQIQRRGFIAAGCCRAMPRGHRGSGIGRLPWVALNQGAQPLALDTRVVQI
ncbi:hypothetical protein F5X68DRAFT_207261 [Plectosphaerella plurivora]|uniref:Uncharacterized protein n=1 Tax=Plectosphaerella plurivora TaxID=936078 RepID=A0A9P8VAE8_9PEZI|nr:hypothetical protein F5X68DRAFT_207261 [Plectosphaerella plurivora]